MKSFRFILTIYIFLLIGICTYAFNPVIKLAGKGMMLLKPIFSIENKLQAALLGTLGKVDKNEIKSELTALSQEPCVIYTYGLSPFSTEAIALLEKSKAKFEIRELGLEWFLLNPRASVLRAELLELTGQSSLPHIFIGGEHIGGLATGDPGLIALVESGELDTKLMKAKASLKSDTKKKTGVRSPFKLPF